MLFFKRCYVNTKAGVDAVSIMHDLKFAIRDSKSPDGLLTVIVPKSGAGLVITTPTEDVVGELKTALEVFAGEAGSTKDKLKREREVAPIVQSSILGRTVHIPFQEGELSIDHHDDVLLVDFEKKGSRREFVVQIISEAPPCPGHGAEGQGEELGQFEE